jgi:prepilin-type processing-associated H-X9-DG protein
MDTLASLVENNVVASDEPTVKRRAGRRPYIVAWTVLVGIAGLLAAVAAVGVVHSVRASRRMECAVRLNRLGLALHYYQEAHGFFPPPALNGPDGTPLLSWRVAVLPHLGYGPLYERFHLGEPWDSPHNRALLAEMPSEFACPGGPGRSAGRTGYRVVVGPPTDPYSANTPFEPTRGVDIREITDGTSNTILVFETDALVPWTKPDDLHWARGEPPPRLASRHPGGANVLFADGVARFVASTIAPETLEGLLTINGAEVLGRG